MKDAPKARVSSVISNQKEAGCEEDTNAWANLWSDEQKSHMRLFYLNEFDWEFLKRGVPYIRYADDIVLLAKSRRASERLLESSTRYLEEKLKLTVNREKSRTVSVFAIRNFKFLGFALGRNKSGIYVRVHAKSWEKFKSKLKELSSRKCCQSIKPSLERIKVYARGWLNYYGIASMKSNMNEVNGWLYHRIRMCIWKQWKRVRTRYRNLRVMGVPKDLAWKAANNRRGYWFTTHTVAINMAKTKERLINSGLYDLATAYQSVHVNYQKRCIREPYVQCCERTAVSHPSYSIK